MMIAAVLALWTSRHKQQARVSIKHWLSVQFCSEVHSSFLVTGADCTLHLILKLLHAPGSTPVCSYSYGYYIMISYVPFI